MRQTEPGARQAAAAPTHVPPAVGLLLVLFAATGFGLLPLLSRMVYASGVPPEVATFYRFGLPAMLFLPVLPRLARAPRVAAISVATGLFLGFGVLGYFRALNDMPVAVAALIFFTFPLFAMVIGFVVFGLRPDGRSLAGAVLVLAACGLFLGPGDLASRPMAVAHAFLAPVAYATLILVVSHVLAGADRIAVLSGLYFGTAITSGAVVLASGAGPLVPDDGAGLAAAIAIVTVGGILPQLALVIGAPAIGPARTAIVAAFELVVALAMGWAVIGETARAVDLAAAALVLAAVVLAALARPSRTMPAPATHP